METWKQSIKYIGMKQQYRPFTKLSVFYVPFTMYYNKHHRQSAQIHQIHEKISPFNLLFSFCQLNSSTEKKGNTLSW